MTDKEKIKVFIIWQGLQIKSFKHKLNAYGMAALMNLNDVCKDWTDEEILKLVDKLGGDDNDR